MRRVAWIAGCLLLIAPPAAADPEVEAGDNEFVASSETTSASSNTTTDQPAATTSDVQYVYEPLCSRGDGAGPDVYYGCGDVESCGDDGELYLVTAITQEESTPAGTICVESGDTPAADVLTPGRILEAFERIPLPEAPLEVQPPGGVTLVNFDTILHTEAQPFTETVQLLNRQITFDIEPAEFTWTLGDGSTLSTTDPGRAWRAGLPMDEYVSHRYAKAGTVQLQITTTWSARWRLPNGPWRPVDGTVDVTSPPQQLEVTTARPQLVSYD